MDQLQSLSKELRELCYGNQVDRIPSTCSPLTFYREYVAQNRPCIIEGALSSWAAPWKWTDEYLVDKLAEVKVTVDMTPNGRADAVLEGNQPVFATPYKETMPFPSFLNLLHSSKDTLNGIQAEVPYLQHQNNNFTEEFSTLMEDVEPGIPWAEEVFGCKPEATNLWIGDHRSETSFHKDHYENLYAVVAGSKTFTLLPPADVYRMHLRRYPLAEYTRCETSGRLEAKQCVPRQEVLWSAIDPYPCDPEAAAQKFPHYFDGPPPLQCIVRKGEVLYLPSIWFHYVQQTPDESGRVIAVNYWYDMRFDSPSYAYFKHVELMAETLGCNEEGPQSENETIDDIMLA